MVVGLSTQPAENFEFDIQNKGGREKEMHIKIFSEMKIDNLIPEIFV